MQTLQSGQNIAVADASIEVSVSFARGTAIDVSAYVLGVDSRVSGDGDMVFYGQVRDASGSVRMARNGPTTTVSIDAAALPSRVDRVAICAAVDADSYPDATFAAAHPVEVLLAGSDGSGAVRFLPDFAETSFAAVTLCEIYRRDGKWKFRAVAQGFAGGLKPLSEMYGVTVADDESPAPQKAVPEARPASAKSVGLSKISLTKERPSISLAKTGASFGTVSVNLNWNRRSGGRGLFGGGVDLDLGCLFELSDGSKGVVQALGNAFGSLERPPFVALSGDDRSGSSADGEWLRIAGDRWTSIRRVLVFAYIYDGAPNWASTDGVVTVTAGGQPPVEVRMDETSGLGMCGVALLENDLGKMRIGREVRYFRGHSEMDLAYGWNMNWRAGSK